MMRSSPPTFRLPPHWGHDVGDRLSNPLGGLVGSKTEFSVPSVASVSYKGNLRTNAQTVKHGSRNSRWRFPDCHLGNRRVVRWPGLAAPVADRRRVRRHLADCRPRRSTASSAQIIGRQGWRTTLALCRMIGAMRTSIICSEPTVSGGDTYRSLPPICVAVICTCCPYTTLYAIVKSPLPLPGTCPSRREMPVAYA